MPSKAVRARGWCFTINEGHVDFDDIKLVLAGYRYVIAGHEIAPETGHEHTQGYVYFDKRMAMKPLLAMFEKMAVHPHLEAARGSPTANKRYCSKEGDWFEDGELPEQGKRSDIVEVIDRIKEGATMMELFEEHPATTFRMMRNVKATQQLFQKKRNFRPVIVTLIGDPGCGKTRWVHTNVHGALYVKPDTGTFWEQYANEESVLLDDYDGQYPYRALLQLLDRFEHTVNIKGSSGVFNSKFIFITSNKEPSTWYPDHAYEQGPLQRRLSNANARVFHVPAETADLDAWWAQKPQPEPNASPAVEHVQEDPPLESQSPQSPMSLNQMGQFQPDHHVQRLVLDSDDEHWVEEEEVEEPPPVTRQPARAHHFRVPDISDVYE